MRERILDLALGLLIACVVFSVHFRAQVVTISDSTWNVYTALSLLDQGDADLNEYEALLKGMDFWAIDTIDGRHYNYFPIGPSIFAVPLIAAARKFPGGLLYFNQNGFAHRDPHTNLQLYTASCATAIAAMLMYLIARFGLRRAPAFVLALLFAFGTPLYSTASRALWQHGPSLVFLCATLLALVAAKRDERWLPAAGIAMALAFVMRPTNAIAVVFLSLYVLLQHRRGLALYLAGAAAVALPYLLYNINVYDAWFPPYSAASRVGGWNSFAQALPANLISPARGVLVFSPIVALSVAGLWLLARRGMLGLFDVALLLIPVAHLIVVSRFGHWWLGHSFGPRGMTDMFPFFFWFLIPVLQEIDFRNRAVTAGRVLLLAVLILTSVWSVFVHYRGANDTATLFWNVTPVDVDQDPTRVWDWSDPQFLRGL
ncbi:MAG: glycosyltransferase family 39 protein [bacterium]|nr:glycosyltransferase family 39 protein [bacterium]